MIRSTYSSLFLIFKCSISFHKEDILYYENQSILIISSNITTNKLNKEYVFRKKK